MNAIGRLPRLALAVAMAIVASGAVAACSDDPGCSTGASGVRVTGSGASGGCTRVLFVGNSYTFTNDLPGTFRSLAASGGHKVAVETIAQGGAMLRDALAAKEAVSRIQAGQWTAVVLQEQSEVPADPSSRDLVMYPAVRQFVAAIEPSRAQPVLFETWAHRDGWPERGLGYAAMQQAIDDAYRSIAAETGAKLARVGEAWWIVHDDHPSIALWSGDGSHPSAAGTYLAACVFYAAIFGSSPVGLGYTGVSTADARVLQTAAAVVAAR